MRMALPSRDRLLGLVCLASLASAAAATAIACGGAAPTQFGAGGDGGSGGNGSGSGPTTGTGTGTGNPDGGLLGNVGNEEGGATSGCSQAAQLVYVLSADEELYSFDPPNKVFTKIGTLACNAPGLQANSMAVSRDGTAWVNYFSEDGTTGSIFKVSTTDASCQSTNVTLQQGWTQVGMGFSSDASGSTSETLFVAATGNGGGITLPPIPGFDASVLGGLGGSDGLGMLNLTTQALSPIGAFSSPLTGQSAELTGTGDGRLFGFFTTTPIQIAQIDKTSGGTSNVVPLSTVEVPSDWAFSFWGGDFYLYTAPAAPASRTTNVTHYSPSTQAVDTSYMTNIGFRIVGAGVSTCAPTVAPPK